MKGINWYYQPPMLRALAANVIFRSLLVRNLYQNFPHLPHVRLVPDSCLLAIPDNRLFQDWPVLQHLLRPVFLGDIFDQDIAQIVSRSWYTQFCSTTKISALAFRISYNSLVESSSKNFDFIISFWSVNSNSFFAQPQLPSWLIWPDLPLPI